MVSSSTHGFDYPDGFDPVGTLPAIIAALVADLEARVKTVDSGNFQIALAAGVAQDVTVDFNFAFPSPPNVVAIPSSGVADASHITLRSRTTTQAIFRVIRTTTVNTTFHWMAHG